MYVWNPGKLYFCSMKLISDSTEKMPVNMNVNLLTTWVLNDRTDVFRKEGDFREKIPVQIDAKLLLF